MKKTKNFIVATVLIMLLTSLFITATPTYSVGSGYVYSLWIGVQNGALTVDEALSDIMFYYNAGVIPASEIDYGLLNGYFPGYRDYFISQGIPLSGGSPQSAVTETQQESAHVQESTSDNQPKSEKLADKKNVEAGIKEPTAEEIDAAWEKNERVEPTCTEVGKIIETNSITGETRETEIPMVAHDYAETDRVEPTCTEDGIITYTCSVCGDTYTESIPATGHDSGEWVVTTETGLFSAGSQELRCTIDGAVLDTQEIPQTAPISLTVAIVICVAIIAVIAIIVLILIRKHKTKS